LPVGLALALLLKATPASAEIDLFDCRGCTGAATSGATSNPGSVANGNNNAQYNLQSNVIRAGASYELDGVNSSPK